MVVGFDMGGTTLDLGLVRDGSYGVDEAPEIRGVRVRLPVPGILSVGLGGSSIASADSTGAVTVGPASAGAVPGPAAFGRGGTEPTLTDADVVTGLLNDGQPLPGDIVLDAERAAAALAPLADGDPAAAARLVHAAAHTKAAAAIASVLSAAGIDPAEVTLYAFGGAGGLHAGAVAELAGIGRIRSFAAGGVFSARGVAEASVEQRYQAAVEPGDDPVEALSRLLARARLDLEAERLPSAEARITVAFDLHDGPRRSAAANIDVDPAAVAAELLGRSGGTDEVARVEVVAAADGPGALTVALDDPAPASERGVRWSTDAVLTSVVDLSGVAESEAIDGPALIGCSGAVHAIPPGWTAHRDSADSLLWEQSL